MRSALLALVLFASPALAADGAETACLYAMAGRLPPLPGLRVVKAELVPAAPGVARSAPIGQRRKVVGGHLVTELGGVEARYAVTCSLLIDRAGVAHVEMDRSALEPETSLP
jgi:hypothetical protein